MMFFADFFACVVVGMFGCVILACASIMLCVAIKGVRDFKNHYRGMQYGTKND